MGGTRGPAASRKRVCEQGSYVDGCVRGARCLRVVVDEVWIDGEEVDAARLAWAHGHVTRAHAVRQPRTAQRSVKLCVDGRVGLDEHGLGVLVLEQPLHRHTHRIAGHLTHLRQSACIDVRRLLIGRRTCR